MSLPVVDAKFIFLKRQEIIPFFVSNDTKEKKRNRNQDTEYRIQERKIKNPKLQITNKHQ